MGIFILLNTAEREVDKMKIISFMLVLVVGISWKHVEARPQDDEEGDADFWYGDWGYGPRPAALKEIVAKEEDDVGSKADKIANAADAGGWGWGNSNYYGNRGIPGPPRYGGNYYGSNRYGNSRYGNNGYYNYYGNSNRYYSPYGKRSADFTQPQPAQGQAAPSPAPVKKVIVAKEEKDVGNIADKIVKGYPY